ncbi:MAG: adenosine kinase [Hormoscilla sp. GUM202]|nr:adenosine kinase [Hormoscilla sp. GUM202]
MTESSKEVDVFGVGNALVDILALVKDDLILSHELNRGAMTLVDAPKQGVLLQDLEGTELQLRSGGSAANTMIALAQSGGNGFYSGKVSRDSNGEFYRQDMLKAGIQFDVAPADSGPTGTCVVLTTPDAERTMCTNLGVSITLSAADIDVDKLKGCKYSYVEGYLWDGPEPRQASVETMFQSQRHGVRVAYTFSDAFLVDRFKYDFRQIVPEYCDVLFCNGDEARRFCELESIEECAAKMGELVDLAFITDGGKGCLVVENKQISAVPGLKAQAIDTVGAGDAFAGGVLFGLTHGYSAIKSARWGNYLGSQVVQRYGPRLEGSQANKLAEIMGGK